jgi:multiple sugar transport system substrate-binding protein
MKKPVLVFLCVFLSSLLFAGAAKDQGANAQSGRVSVRYQDWRLTEEPSGSIIKAVVAEYEKTHPNVTVVLEPVPAAERDRQFIVQSEGGDAPDMVRGLAASIPNFVEKGYLLPIDRYVGSDFKAKWAPHLIKSGEWKGNLYAVPCEGDVYLLYINRDIWVKAGLDPNKIPATWQEWLDAMKKINDPVNKVFGTVAQGLKALGPPLAMQSFFLANGTDYFNDDYSDIAFDTPNGIEAFKFYIELYSVHKLMPNPTETGFSEQMTFFANGNAGTMVNHGNSYSVFVGKNPEIQSKLIVGPMPGKVKATAGRGSLYVFGSKTKNPEATLDLANYLTNQDSNVRFWTEARQFPALLDALNTPAVQNDVVAKAVIAATPSGKMPPLTPAWPAVSNALMTAIQEGYLGVKTPEQALKDAAVEARKALAAAK